ncbi:splicing factor-like protein [Cercophora newfieldiana]|uniref:U4/U6 snRNA-associated-splicing factor PRP24 n=1 Tax=Cercophora newfieldiana TaxID=92897 RepID=A0AA39Y279_9PEZI|nr:splicing factor-like protein [Cercophora newfieldiana]
MASPVGEDNWVGFVDSQLREATDLDARVNIVESFRRAVSAEPGSIKVWSAYCEYFWSLYTDCQPGSDAGWSQEEHQLGREVFTLDAALALWQQAYESVQYRLSDSHELWNRWVSLEMELLARGATEAGIRRITHLFKNRLAVPHATWDATSQMFSTFLSEYNQAAYELEMKAVTINARDAKRIYDMRDPFEMKLRAAARSGDAEATKAIMSEYLDWEIKQSKGKRDAVANFQICLGLFSRAQTGELASDEDTWLNFVVFISSARSELKAGRSRIPANLLPNMLDVLQRAVHHVPWCGTIWARYILAAEEAGLSFTDIERIKHAATSSAQLDRDGMMGVLEMYAAWCGYLKRTAMNPNATEEAVDIADVGLASAIEDVKHWGKRRYGDTYQGDPNFRLEKILIQFLTEKKDDIEAARSEWGRLADINLYANSYDFWLNWFLWEMVVFTATKNKTRSPTPATLAHGLRVPSHATNVFKRALKVRTLDWPERIMEVYIQHCNDYELADTLREAQDTVYKTKKGVAKRREREAAQAAAAQAEYAAQVQDQTMADAPHVSVESAASPSSKRKREESPDQEGDKSGKRAKSEGPNGVDAKRDREHTSVFVAGLPSDATQTKVRQFFREYGHVNNIDIQRKGDSAVALVEFRTPDEARSALLRDGKPFGEREVQVTSATDCTLYVTNYPPEADDAYIRKLFKGCGEIHSIRFPSLKYNTMRRFCYLTFRDRASAAAATKLDGKSLEGGKFKLSAKISDPGMKRRREGAQAESRELHVSYVPRHTTDDDLRQLFAKAGTVISVRVPRDMAGRTKGSAFIVMETKEQAQEAINTFDKVVFANHALKVELSKPLNQKTTATSHGAGSAGSPEAESPAAGASPLSAPGFSNPTHAEISARTIAVLGIPDTMNDTRVRAILDPTGTIVKLVLHPKHGGAIVEFADAASAGKASLTIDGLEVEPGKKLRVGTVPELFRTEGETRIDRIDKPQPQAQAEAKEKKKPSAAELMPPPPNIRRAPLGRSGPKRGLGFVAVKKDKDAVNGTSIAGTAPGGGKSNADFKKMFLGEGKANSDATEKKAENVEP